MIIAEDVKALLSGNIDDKLEVIERRTKECLVSLLNVEEVPKEFDYISYEVTLKRFNRIGQEGMQSYSQEGLSMAFPDSDFDEYTDVIDDWKNRNDLESKRGRLRLY
ncbi:phage head-tail connector protein [Enterococcus faecium]